MPIPATADAPVSEGRDGCGWLWLKWPGGARVSVDVCVRGCVAVRMHAHGWIGGWVGGWVEWAVGWVVVKLGLSGWGELHYDDTQLFLVRSLLQVLVRQQVPSFAPSLMCELSVSLDRTS